ncbi:FecR domain-containing protein [Fulvivirgaceae bacterium BMA10]|uniref:FecR domain-containing protein n=1 Tax=Splendidivirga corallicola TaxID=3051826 RepID=A0ABT8KMZ5_9BACT|nr:FecR domain-containing protein [Fulvivirgaceae bacterium BMA10]
MPDYSDYNIEDFASDADFVRFVTEPTKEDISYWESFVKKHPHKKSETEVARDIILSLSDPFKENISDQRVNTLWNRIQNTTHGEHPEQPGAPMIGYRSNSGNRGLRIAAGLFIFVLAGLLAYFLYFRGPEPQPEIQWVVKSNPKGQKSTVFLPDGSKVILNAQSSLTYTKGFLQDKREIELEGEAFFEVKRDSIRPFIVKTRNTVSTVLGTSFNVRSFSSEDIDQVSLVTGKLVVSSMGVPEEDPSKSQVLVPGEYITYSPETMNLVKSRGDISDYLLWKDGVILFKEANFEEIVTKLERWFGVEFETVNQIRGPVSFSTKFENENLENILNTISHTLDFDYEINENKVSIKFN